MAIVRRAFAPRATSGSTSGIATPEKWVEDWFGGGETTAAGVYVSEETAMHYAPWFSGVRIIAEDVGSLPLAVFERLKPKGKRHAMEHPLYPLLQDAPNDLMTAVDLRQTLQGHALTWPTAYAYIVREKGVVTELWPLRPDRVTPDPRTQTGIPGRLSLTYVYRDPVNGIYARLLPDEVLTIRGLGFDGVTGYSLVAQARQSIASAVATERYGAAFYGNGSRPSGVLTHPKTLSEEGRKRLSTDWENLHRGLDRAHRVAILEGGMKWEAIGISPEHAQFLETRKLNVTEMARWLRLPPHKLADLERATFSNIEHLGIDYVTSALRIWLVRWEQAIKQKLLTREERGRYFAKHDPDVLMRGDFKTRQEGYAIGRNWGLLSADDVAEREDMNPLPDGRGTTYLIPLNMVVAPTPEQADAAASVQQSAAARRMAEQLRGRGLEARRQIAESYVPLVEDADRRIAKLERAEVGSLVRRYLEPRALAAGRTVQEFSVALDVLYQGLVHDRSVKALLPVLSELAKEIAASSAADVAFTGEVDLSRWIADYVSSHVDYRVGSAVRKILKDVTGVDEEAGAKAVTERLAKWVELRPARTATWETAQVPNAAAREAYKAAGVRKLTWHTSGDTCPFCVHLDGTVVGIDEPFMAAGDKITGLEAVLNIDRVTFHPPLHPGCDCQVVPE